jgi:flagellar basal-body rod modification protein FlgD
MISGISPNDASSNTSGANAGSTGNPSATGTSQVTKNMFLQLLVAQIKNQDPMSPADGVQFLTQLAQFQQLEQSINSGQDLSAIRSDLDKLLQTSASPNANQTN